MKAYLSLDHPWDGLYTISTNTLSSSFHINCSDPFLVNKGFCEETKFKKPEDKMNCLFNFCFLSNGFSCLFRGSEKLNRVRERRCLFTTIPKSQVMNGNWQWCWITCVKFLWKYQPSPKRTRKGKNTERWVSFQRNTLKVKYPSVSNEYPFTLPFPKSEEFLKCIHKQETTRWKNLARKKQVSFLELFLSQKTIIKHTRKEQILQGIRQERKTSESNETCLNKPFCLISRKLLFNSF